MQTWFIYFNKHLTGSTALSKFQYFQYQSFRWVEKNQHYLICILGCILLESYNSHNGYNSNEDRTKIRVSCNHLSLWTTFTVLGQERFTEDCVTYGELGTFCTGYPFYDPPYRPVSYLPESPERWVQSSHHRLSLLLSPHPFFAMLAVSSNE